MIEQKTKEIIGNRINIAINKKGLKQKDLAKMLGYPSTQENTVSLWIKGKRSPSIEQLIEIATICDTTVDYLVGKTGSYSSDKVLQSAWDNLGLTNYSYELLTHLSEKNKPVSDFINFLLEQIPLDNSQSQSNSLFDKMICYLAFTLEPSSYLNKLYNEVLLNELVDEFKSLKEKYHKEKGK